MPEPGPQPEPAVAYLPANEEPREWNLWELERVARGNATDDVATNEERAYLLMYLRGFAGPDGTLPADFDGLVRDAFGVESVILRYFTVYGPRQRPDMGFRRFMEAALAGRPIVVYGDGEQTRDFTYVDDVVRANLLAMAAPVQVETINIGGGRRVTLNETLDLIGRTTGRRLRVDRRPATPGDVRHTGADGTRAKALLGYCPQTDLATGLAAQATWLATRQRSVAAQRIA